MVNLTTCGICGALQDANESYLHQGFHNTVPSPHPCDICGAAIFPFKELDHQAFHDRQDRLEELLNRLLGSVEAHLEYMSDAEA
jgi:hypothetical protein